jgi:hypothetical protein
MRLSTLVFAAAACVSSACVIDNGGGRGPACRTGTSYTIDTGASISYAPGVDAGYYAAYDAGGHWHFEWTCDTKLSAYGCEFSGSIVADTPAGGARPECFDCEPEDILDVSTTATKTTMTFDTATSTGVDGLDFFAVPGHSVTVDLSINGVYQDDLVFLPSGGRTENPSCMPIDLVPSAP